MWNCCSNENYAVTFHLCVSSEIQENREQTIEQMNDVHATLNAF